VFWCVLVSDDTISLLFFFFEPVRYIGNTSSHYIGNTTPKTIVIIKLHIIIIIIWAYMYRCCMPSYIPTVYSTTLFSVMVFFFFLFDTPLPNIIYFLPSHSLAHAYDRNDLLLMSISFWKMSYYDWYFYSGLFIIRRVRELLLH